MENILYVVIPLIGLAIGFAIKLFERFLLYRRNDMRSRIKREARRIHYEEDNNNRFVKNEDSTYLWKLDSEDEGINRKLKHQAESKGNYEEEL